MSDEKYIVELQDRIDGSIPTKLEQIAEFARSGFSAVDRLQKALQSIDSTAVSQLALANLRAQKALNDSALASQRLATETQRTSSAAAQAAAAQSKLAQANSASATAAARLATEQARTAVQAANAAAASDRAALAALRLQAAKDKLSKSTNNAGNALAFYVKGALSVAAAIQLSKEVLASADAYTVLQNKLQNVSTSQQQVIELTEKLFLLARETRAPVEETATAFTRFDRALSQMGKSQEETLRLTETVNKALIVSGATATEAGSALLQLSQAFNSGKLQGDEFRSIAENMPIVLDAVAKATGKPINQIKQMATEGKITAEVLFKAFKGIEAQVDETFGKTVPTLSQGWQVLKDSVVQAIGEFNKSTGFTQALAEGMIFLAENIKTVVTQVTAFFNVMKTLRIFAVESAKEILFQIWDAIQRAFSDLMLFFKAVANAGIEAVNYIRDKAGLEPIELLKMEPTEAARQFKGFGKLWADALKEGFGESKSVVDFVTIDARKINMQNLETGTGKVRVPKKRSINNQILDESKDYIDGLKILIAYNKELDDQSKLMQLLPREREIEQQMIQISNQLAEKEVYLTNAQSQALRDKLEANQRANAVMQEEDALLSATVAKRQAFVDQLTAINRLQQDASSGFSKGDAAGATTSILQDMGIDTTYFKTQADAFTQTYADMYSQIDLLRQADLISEQEAAGARAQIWAQQQASQLKGASDFFGQMSQLAKSENSKVAAIGKAAAITKAIIDTYTAATGAYAALASIPYVGPALGVAAAAAAITAGMANVNAIRNQGVGYMQGGYTGNIPTSAIAGNVHGQEYVFDAKATERIGVANLDAMRKGASGVQQGVGSGQGANSSEAPQVNVGGPTIVNLQDPALVQAYIDSSEGTQNYINWIGANAGAIKAQLGMA